MSFTKMCHGCGGVIPDESSCCPNCGAIVREIETTFVRESYQKVTPILPSKRESSFLKQPSLVVIEGADKSKEFSLTSDQTRIGRDKEGNDIVLQDTNVSRHHAVISFENHQYTLEDLQSTNGTKVNGKTITKHILTDGDIIQLGDTFLAFYL